MRRHIASHNSRENSGKGVYLPVVYSRLPGPQGGLPGSAFKRRGAIAEKARAAEVEAQSKAEAKSLELLYDYTKFHIGIYITLSSAYLTLIALKTKPELGRAQLFIDLNPYAAGLAMACFMLAGFAGGVIVSSITQYAGPGGTAAFLKTDLGPWNTTWGPGQKWTYVEHTSFWVGMFAAVASVVIPLWFPPEPARQTIDNEIAPAAEAASKVRATGR